MSSEYDPKSIAGTLIIVFVFALMFFTAFGIADDVLTDFRLQLFIGLAGTLLVGGGIWEWLSNISIQASGGDDNE